MSSAAALPLCVRSKTADLTQICAATQTTSQQYARAQSFEAVREEERKRRERERDARARSPTRLSRAA